MSPKVLHVLSQRPSRTGSGITLDAVVRLAESAGWKQAAVVGIPADEANAVVGLLPSRNIFPVHFRSEGDSTKPADLNFFVPGMSDVMPYPSTVWATLGQADLDAYRLVWKKHLQRVISEFKPDLIHSHHIWLVSSLLKDIAPNVPVTTTCHATGLRQLELCPHLASEVISGCRRNDHFLVLRDDHSTLLSKTLNISKTRISTVGIGFRDEIFHRGLIKPDGPRKDLLYVGKFSESKGLPWLLDAFGELNREQPDLCLHIAGDGSGPEAEILRARIQAMKPSTVMHGMMDQENLAQLMRRCHVCVLPSFYEGVPLVLVEAAACGCRLVSTRLPGVLEQIAPVIGNTLEMVSLPRLVKVDKPAAEDLPRFTKDLKVALRNALNASPASVTNLDIFAWSTVFRRVESIWQSITS